VPKTLAQAEREGTAKKPKQYIDNYSFKVSGKGRIAPRTGKTAKDHKSGAHARRIVNQMKREQEVKDGGKRK